MAVVTIDSNVLIDYKDTGAGDRHERATDNSFDDDFDGVDDIMRLETADNPFGA